MARLLSALLGLRESTKSRNVARPRLRPAAEYLEDRSVPATTAVNFLPVELFATGSEQARSVAVADFNGDGNEDLAVVNSFPIPGKAAVLLGDGTGRFELLGTFATGGGDPVAVAVGDFNGDGEHDLAVAHWDADTVGVLFGDGTGQFELSGTFPTGGGGPAAVAVGDFNGDGNDDLAVANEFPTVAGVGDDTVGVLLGDGLGGFGTAVAYPTGGADPVAVVVGDFDGDGTDDLAVANSGSPFGSFGRGVGVLLGDGTGGFGAAVNYSTGGEVYSVAVGDFNGDGHDDLAAANLNTGTVAVLLNDGAGGFGTAVQYATGGTPVSVTVADFNGDGHDDLAVANDGSRTVAVLLGDGSGGFGAAQTFPAGGNATAVAVGDFDADGHPDLAVATFEGPVGVLLNRTFLTRTEDLLGLVRGVIDDRDLTHGRGRALTATLEAAVRQLDRGNTTAAVNQIEAFIKKVEALQRSRVLEARDAQILIAVANFVIARIGV